MIKPLFFIVISIVLIGLSSNIVMNVDMFFHAINPFDLYHATGFAVQAASCLTCLVFAVAVLFCEEHK